MNSEPLNRHRRFARNALICTVVAIAALTLVPTPGAIGEPHESHVLCIACGEFGGTDVMLNIALFVPFGACLALLGLPFRRIALLGLAFTVGIETMQYTMIAGRDASISDVLANTLGTVVGAVVVALWPRLVRPNTRWAQLLFAGTAFAWTGAQFGTAWAVRMDLPPAPWFAQWKPSYRPFAPYSGTIVDVRVGDRFLPADSLRDADDVRRELVGGTQLTVVVTGPKRESFELAPLVRVVGDVSPHREVLLLAQEGSDLVLRTSARAGTLRVHVPGARLDGVLAPGVGDTIRIGAAVSHGEFVLRATRDGVVRQVRVARSASWGWSLLMPFQNSLGASAPVLTGFWIAGWFALLGYWGFLVRRPRALALPAAATAFAGLIGAPLAFGLHPDAGVLLPAVLGATVGILTAFVILCRTEYAARLANPPVQCWTVVRGSGGHSAVAQSGGGRSSGGARRVTQRRRTIP